MILSIIALLASILALAYQIYTTLEQDRKWDEYFENERKRKQKQALVQMMQDDERDGMYEDEMIVKSKEI
jgi:hypothetical protein